MVIGRISRRRGGGISREIMLDGLRLLPGEISRELIQIARKLNLWRVMDTYDILHQTL